MFFERVQGNDVYNAALNPPFAYQPSATNVYFSNPNTSAADWGHNATAFPVHADQYQVQLSASWDSRFQLRIAARAGASVVAVIQYVGSTGWDQNDDRQINTLPLADLTHRQASCQRAATEHQPVSKFPRLRQHQPGRKRDQFQLPLAPGRHSRSKTGMDSPPSCPTPGRITSAR